MNNRGYARAALGDHAAAVSDYNRALELDPKFFGALSTMAELHIALGKFDMALVWIGKAVAHDPTARAHMRDSADYDPIRIDPRFRSLVGE